MVWKSFSLILWICSVVSNAQVTKVEEISLDVDKSYEASSDAQVSAIMDGQSFNSPSSASNSYQMQPQQQQQQQAPQMNYRSFMKPSSFNSYNQPMYNAWNPGMSSQMYSAPQYGGNMWNQMPRNYWASWQPQMQPPPQMQGPQMQSSMGEYGVNPWLNNFYQGSGDKPAESSSLPTVSTFTDYKNGFYPGPPNWRKSYTPSVNGCYNRCRPSCSSYGGNSNNYYGCRPNCRPHCNIRPTCGPLMPSYYGDTLVCSKNGGYYGNNGAYGAYQQGVPQMSYSSNMEGNQRVNPTLESTASSG